jgi:hypothetical protein
MHDFLFSVSGGLKKFYVVLSAQKSINALANRALAHSFFISENCALQPALFARAQRREYALLYFQQFPNDRLRDFIAANGEPPEATRAVLERRICAKIAAESDSGAAIISAVLEHANAWKEQFNHRFHLQQPLCAATDDDFVYCRFFAGAVDAVAFELVMQCLSACPFTVAARGGWEGLARALREASEGEQPWLSCTAEAAMRHAVVKIRAELSSFLSWLIATADAAAKEAFEAGELRFGLGDWAVVFLEIEAMLKEVMDDPAVVLEVSLDRAWIRMFMSAVCKSGEPVALRAWLKQVLMAVAYLDGNNPMIVELDTIGNPITPEILKRFQRLREWFGFGRKLMARTGSR